MKDCPDCEREQKRLEDAQLYFINECQARRQQEEIQKQKEYQESLEKLQKAVDYHNMRKDMTFMQKLKELFK